MEHRSPDWQPCDSKALDPTARRRTTVGMAAERSGGGSPRSQANPEREQSAADATANGDGNPGSRNSQDDALGVEGTDEKRYIKGMFWRKVQPRIHQLCQDPDSFAELQKLIKKLKKKKKIAQKAETLNKAGQKPIHVAVEAQNLRAVKLLINKAKVDLNATDRNGWTPLHLACYLGNLAMVELLLSFPMVDVDVQSVDFSTPLHYMVRHAPGALEQGADSMPRYLAILKRLLGKQGKVYGKVSNNTSAINRNKDTPLHTAAASGSFEAVEWLLQNHADVNKCNKFNETALHMAVRRGSVKVVVLLLEKGASEDIVGVNGSPKELAADNEAILALLKT